MRIRFLLGKPAVLGLVLLLPLAAGAAGKESHTRLIISCQGACDPVVSQISALGGELQRRLAVSDAVAVTVPSSALPELARLGKPMVKDVPVARPAPVTALGDRSLDITSVEAAGTRVLDVASLGQTLGALPADYNYNNSISGATALHAQGKIGSGVIVAVIDTGVSAVALSLTGNVIGGDSLVVGDPVASPTSPFNDPHGTFVSSLIAAHAAYFFTGDAPLVQSLRIHSPESVIACPTPVFPTCPAGAAAVPMIGTAPGAEIYSIKVLASDGQPTPTSTVVAGMERALTLKRNFNAGMPSVPVAGDGTPDNPFSYDSLNIQVVNMSLGGPSLAAADDLEAKLTEQMLEAGITIVTSAGNGLLAAMTGGSPGTGRGALTVGAADTPVHERVFWDLEFGIGVGAQIRANDIVQTAFFSSRGPTADGRFDPDLIANGFASYGDLPLGGPGLGTGTSFSAPIVAGAAALLRAEVPGAQAVQIRNALVTSANPRIVGDGSTRIDQGSGFLDVQAALALLQSGQVDTALPVGLGSKSVLKNVASLGFQPVSFVDNRFQGHVGNLKPGQVAQFFVKSEGTEQFVVKVRNFTTALPPDQQNQALGGDQLLVHIVDAPTSFAKSRFFEPALGDADYVIDNPQVGLLRVAIQGAWTNAGGTSADLIIERQLVDKEKPTASGKIRQDDLLPFSVNVPAGTQQLVVEASWEDGWEAYPTSDLDLFLIYPVQVVHPGVTLDAPERVVIDQPSPGLWGIILQGFAIQGRTERFHLSVTADGVRLRTK